MKIKVNNTILLSACVIILALLCVLSVDSPMRFNRQKAKREAVVYQRIDKIKAAENKYLARHGNYAGSLDALVKEGFLADSLTYVPYSDDERFTVHATIAKNREGQEVPQVTCSAEYIQYLKGLDRASVTNLIDQANEEGRFPGITK